MDIEQENSDKTNKLKENKKGRIIVRNLIYDISEKHVRALFQKYGKIQDINLPINPSTNKAKGFAFIQFENPNLAKKVIKELNGQSFKGRKIFLDLAVAKEKYENLKQNKSKFQESEKQDSDQSQDVNDSEEEEVGKNQAQIPERDEEEFDTNWKMNLHKSIKNQTKVKGDKNIPHSKNDIKFNKELQNDIEADCEDVDEDEKLESQEKGSDSIELEEEQQIPQQQKQKKVEQIQTQQDLNSTIFVRSISYDVTEEEFKEFFEQFGKLHYAKLVLNPDTHDNRGTGFVKFVDENVAKQLILKNQSKKKYTKNKDKNSTLEQILNEGIDDDNNLELHGRRLIILPALNRNQAQQIVQKDSQNSGNGHIQDIRKIKSLDKLILFDKLGKRNLALAKLGLFEAEKFMDEQELQKREVHLQEKLEKLKNPNMIVSKTRLLLKNLPKINFDETNIKAFALKSIKDKFQEEEIKNKKLIKRIKLLREKEKLDQNGIQKSKGIALLEFTKHKYAMCFLQYCCQQKRELHKQYKKLPIIEFSIEDIRKVKKRENVIQQMQSEHENNEERKQNQEKKAKQNAERQKEMKSNKLLIQQLLEKDIQSNEDKQQVYNLLGKIKSRGAKQRMKKLVDKKLGTSDNNPQQNGPADVQVKQLQKEVKQIIKTHKISERPEQLKEKIQKIKLIKQQEKQQYDQIRDQIKRKKQQKLRLQDHDELDDIVNQHLNKIQKKAKWSNE